MINLLPPQYKKELLEEEKYRLVLISGVLISIFLISLILVLFSIRNYLWGEVESAKILTDSEEKYFQTSEMKTLQGKIILANQNISKLNSFYQSQSSLVEIIQKISQTLPSEAYLTAFSFEKSTSQISLSGFALTREVLFEFKKNLEEKKEFKEIYFPPSSWIEPENIDFSLTLKVISPK